MLIGGYLGEAGYLSVWPAFIIGMAGWAFILYEIFLGQAGKISAANPADSANALNIIYNAAC